MAAAKNTKINVADCTGVYEDHGFGKIEVFLKGDPLYKNEGISPDIDFSFDFQNLDLRRK